MDRREDRRRSRRQGPQDRTDLEGDAERARYRRARFGRAARRHVLRRWRARALRPLHRHTNRGRTRLRHEAAAVRPELHSVRCAQCHGFRGAGAGDPGYADRAHRSEDQSDPQDLRHHRRQRGQCRHRARRQAAASARCGPALDRRALLQEWPARRNRARRRRAQPSRDRGRLARQQDRARMASRWSPVK